MEIDGLIGIWYNLLNLFDVVTISHQASLQRYIMLYHTYLWDFGFTQIPKKDGASFEALRSGYRCQQSLLPSWHGFCKIWEISKISKRWPWHIGRWPHIGAKSGRRLVESRVPQGEGTLRSSNRPEIICLPPFANDFPTKTFIYIRLSSRHVFRVYWYCTKKNWVNAVFDLCRIIPYT